MAIRPQQVHPVPEPLVRALEALRHELDIPDDFPPAVHDAAVAAAMAGDISGALDILRGIDAGTPGEGDGEDADDATGGSAQLLGSLTGGGDDTEDPQAAAFGS